MDHTVDLSIAGTIIKIQSTFPNPFIEQDRKDGYFFYFGKKRPDIVITVHMVSRLPEIKDAPAAFVTYHPEDNSENWRLFKKKDRYIYMCPLRKNKQVMFINKNFNRVEAYLVFKKNVERGRERDWYISDITHDFLQVFLIHYLARRKKGIFMHAAGLKDEDGSGLVFAGKGGAGKSTKAKLWQRASKAVVLNDDRVIIREIGGKFFIFASIWSRDFGNYISSITKPAALKKIFFIRPGTKNQARPLTSREAFPLLYPVIFLPFWDRYCLKNAMNFSQRLIGRINCLNLSFKNNKSIIQYVRSL